MEVNRRKCKVCGEIKVRQTLDNKFPNGRDKKHVDAEGKLWSGNTCPSCHRRIVATRKRNRTVGA
jgi:hypothetical protein